MHKELALFSFATLQLTVLYVPQEIPPFRLSLRCPCVSESVCRLTMPDQYPVEMGLYPIMIIKYTNKLTS